MLFNSALFLIFFPSVVLLHFALPQRLRWILLLAASYFFYMCWRPEYVVLLWISTGVDYFAGLRMGALPSRTARRKYLALSLASNLGLLFGFKYLHFATESVANPVLAAFGVAEPLPVFDVLLPIGISFYTFQTLGYAIDVYRGVREPERHLGIFALYVSFFPQLVAGPIERATRLLPQFRAVQRFDLARIADGLQLMLWGFFKKLVIADRVAVYVNQAYNHPGEYEGATVVLATYLFAFQIFCDFSGYSDIAIGSARVLGYDLMENFRRPYFARGVREFWSRWHISLSTWFRDYLYIPLGGNRVAAWRWQANLLIVFLVSGLWHGASWTFLVWGGLHGCYLVFGNATRAARERLSETLGLTRRPRLRAAFQGFVTFHLVVLAWCFFRANSLDDAFVLLGSMLSGWQLALPVIPEALGRLELVVAIVAILSMEAVHAAQERGGIGPRFAAQPAWLRWPAYYALMLATLFLGVFEGQEFIYFQF